jgi:hypothetical protein
MTLAHGNDDPVIAQPPLTLTALRAAVTAVAPVRLSEFFESMQDACTRAGEQDSVTPIHVFYRPWAVVIEIERHHGTAHRLHDAEHAVESVDPEVRERAIGVVAEIVHAAHHAVDRG